MKRYAVILFCLFMCMLPDGAFAEEAKAPPTTAADVAMRVEKDLASGIEKLANKLEQVVETTAPVVWRSLVKQQVVMGLSQLGNCGLFILIATVLGIWWKRLFKDISESEDLEYDGLVGKIIINGILSAITFILVCVMLTSNTIGHSIAMIVNPEYYAMQELISAVK